ncbi:hypothetical protein D3C85_613840 [compost metagenome]
MLAGLSVQIALPEEVGHRHGGYGRQGDGQGQLEGKLDELHVGGLGGHHHVPRGGGQYDGGRGGAHRSRGATGDPHVDHQREQGRHQQHAEAGGGAHRQRHGAGHQVGGHQQYVGGLDDAEGLAGQLHQDGVGADVAHVAGKAAQHHDQHAEAAAPVHQQEAHVLEHVGSHVAGGSDAGRQHRLAHQGGDRQQQEAAAEQHPGRRIALEDVATHGQGDQGANKEFHHK